MRISLKPSSCVSLPGRSAQLDGSTSSNLIFSLCSSNLVLGPCGFGLLYLQLCLGALGFYDYCNYVPKGLWCNTTATKSKHFHKSIIAHLLLNTYNAWVIYSASFPLFFHQCWLPHLQQVTNCD